MRVRPVYTLALALVMAVFSTLGAAQMNHGNMHSPGMTGGDMHSPGMAGGNTRGGSAQDNVKTMPTPQEANSTMSEGMVKKVDKSKGTVTLVHSPMDGTPAMIMDYKVKVEAWLDQLQTGQRIRFATDPADGGMTVAKFELAK